MKLTKLFAVAALLASTTVSTTWAETQLKLWNLTSSSEKVTKHWDKVIAGFEAKNPGVKVTLETFPTEAYKTGLQVALSSDSAPDVFFNWSGEDAATLGRNGLVADLTKMGNGAGEWNENVGKGLFDAYSVNGKIYGVPTHMITKYFFYNTEYFKTNNLSVPKTMDETLAMCKKIREIDPRMAPISLGNAEKWKALHYISTFNQKLVGEKQVVEDYTLRESGENLFADPGYVGALQTMVDMSEAGCFNKAPNATTADASRSLFAVGKAATIYCGNWCPGTFDEGGLKDGYDLARLPSIPSGKGDQGYNFALLEGFQIAEKSQNKEAAAKFLSFLVSDEIQAERARDLGRLPINAKGLNENDGTPIFRKIAADAATYTGLVRILDVDLEKTVSELYLTLIQEVLNGTVTPEDAMMQIRAKAKIAKG